jgi:hypothetical protein
MALKDLAQQPNNISVLDRLRKFLVREGFKKCNNQQLEKVPYRIYSFTRNNEVWMLRFPSTVLYVQLAKDNVLVSNSSTDIFFKCSDELASITGTITTAAHMIAERESRSQKVDI